jgi:hypothetical protein
MKKYFKILATVLMAAAALSFLSCSEEDDNSSSPKSALDIASDSLYIVSETADTVIELPLYAASSETVTVSWESSDNTVIRPQGYPAEAQIQLANVYPKEGNGSDSIKLTATLTDTQGKTKTKVFTVKVYQESAELSDDTVLKLASEKLAALFTAPGLAWIDKAYLRGSISAGSKNIAVDIEESDYVKDEGTVYSVQPHPPVVIGSYAGIYIYRNYIDQNVSIKAHLTYNGKKVDKTYKLFLPAVKEFNNSSSHYKIDNDSKTITVEEYENENGVPVLDEKKKYSFIADYEGASAVISFLKISSPEYKNGAWVSLEEDTLRYYTKYENVINAIIDFEKITEPSINDLYNVYKYLIPLLNGTEGIASREDFFSFVGSQFSISGFTEAAYNSLPAENKAQIIAGLISGIDTAKDTLVEKEHKLGLSAGATISEIAEALESYKQVELAARKAETPENISFDFYMAYTTPTDTNKTGAYIVCNAKYDSSRAWYEQYAAYRFHDYNTDKTYSVSRNKIEFEDKDHSVYNGWKWNEDYTVFTKRNVSSSYNVSYNNTDNTITLSDGTVTKVLEFSGWAFDK